MDKLEGRSMKCNAIDEPLRRFRRMIFSIANHRVTDRRKLHSDLIL